MEKKTKKQTKSSKRASLFDELREVVERYEVQAGVKVEQVTFNRNSRHQDDRITSIFLKTA